MYFQLEQLQPAAYDFNHLSAKFIKWSNTLKQIVGKLPTICLGVFDHFSGLAFKGLIMSIELPVIVYILNF